MNVTNDGFKDRHLHIEDYLISKGEIRKYHYCYDDMQYLDEEEWESLYNHALKGSSFALQRQRLDFLQSGVDESALIYSGAIPLNLASSLLSLRKLKVPDCSVYRNNRPNHESESDSQ